jgi:hypothetical protein
LECELICAALKQPAVLRSHQEFMSETSMALETLTLMNSTA